MERRKFTREFKLEAVKLIKERVAGHRLGHLRMLHSLLTRRRKDMDGRDKPGHDEERGGRPATTA